MASNRPPFPPLKVNPHEAFFTAAILCRYNHSSMAQTPWGELAIQDAHVHFFSHKFYSALAQQKKAANAEALAPLLNFEIPTAAAYGTG